MDLKKNAIESNKNYWKSENCSDDNRGFLLYENFYDTPQLCYGMSKVALCIAKSLNLRPAVLVPWKELEVTKSMCERRFQIKHEIFYILIKRMGAMIKTFFISKIKLLELAEDNAIIGPCIYDSLLRKYNKKTIVNLSIQERLFVVLQLCYYYYFKSIINKYPICCMVLGDSVYRYGLLYELCRVNKIACYTPVNLNSLFICKYSNEESYHHSYLNNDVVDMLCRGVDYGIKIDDYYKKRYKGLIEQHDVLTAYGNKQVSDRLEFAKRYNLIEGKKTAVIMCHVFADAPHVYLNTLYDDYWDWFVGSLNNLLKNRNVNVLIKEHPSSHLYNQKGIVKEYLNSRNLDHLMVQDNESTESILDNADIVITCGGTIGLEFSYRGKNVVLASYPPYGKLGFTTEFNSREQYEYFLREEIQNLQPLTPKKMEIAKKVSYVMFYLQDNSPKELELGGEGILLGKKYDDSILYKNILNYNQIPLVEQQVYKLLTKFVESNQVALFKKN